MTATELLERVKNGDGAAENELFKKVYEAVYEKASGVLYGQEDGQTLNATALVNEAWLHLFGNGRKPWQRIQNSRHLCNAMASAMRHALVDYARRKKAQKRGGDWQRVLLEGVELTDSRPGLDVLELNDLLEKLAGVDSRAAQVVELRFFGGAGWEEIADVLGVCKKTAQNDWKFAKAWLKAHLSD